MPGLMIGDVKLEIEVEKLRAIADRLYATGEGEKEKAMVDGAAELRRLADGFDALREAEQKIAAERRAAMSQAISAAMMQLLPQVIPPCNDPNCPACRERNEQSRPN